MSRHLIFLPFLLLLAGGLLFSLTKDRVYRLNLADAPTFEEAGEPIVNPNFFYQTKERLIKEKTDFIEADLSAMKVTLYEAGEPGEVFPILTKGREGSWWETPAGIYHVGSKAVNHFSSFGQVYQPWSIQFQGNFFIHGWPYYPDGTPVASSYSGGCIRLSSEDAQRLFEKVKIGTPVLVFEESFINGDGFSYTSLQAKPPSLKAESYLVADLKNNYVLAGKNSDKSMPLNSIAALMTALVATDHFNIEKRVAVDPILGVEQASIYDLLFPMLLESSGEAAESIASILGKEQFVKLMNGKAQAIGMNNTSFTNSGESTSTAQDIFNLAKYLYTNRSFVLKMTRGNLDTSIYGAPVFKNLRNSNLVNDEPGFIGGKAGENSDGRQSLLAIFEITIEGDKRPIIIIIFNSEDAKSSTKTLLNYIETNY